MSHRATSWLSDIDPARLSASEFRVLFHLCDCHNASAGCFPSQAYLRERAGVSNGTVNTVLASLEAKGFIARHQSRDGKTKRQRPTRYVLGFEMQDSADPSPETGDGSKGGKPPRRLQSTGAGADSSLNADPTPKKRQSRLQPTGEEPVKNQERTARGVVGRDPVQFWADVINTAFTARKKAHGISFVTAVMARQMLHSGLTTEDALRFSRVDF